MNEYLSMTSNLEKFIIDWDYFTSLRRELSQLNYNMTGLRTRCKNLKQSKKETAKRKKTYVKARKRRKVVKEKIRKYVANEPKYISRWKPHLIDNTGAPYDFNPVEAINTACNQRNTVRKTLEEDNMLTRADIEAPELSVRKLSASNIPRTIPTVVMRQGHV